MQEILEVANYLVLGDIVSLCSAYMMANMELDNVVEVLALADSLGLGRLRGRAASFICANFQARIGIFFLKSLYIFYHFLQCCGAEIIYFRFWLHLWP